MADLASDRLVSDARFAQAAVRSHGFVQVCPADYTLSIVDRGADLLASRTHIGPDLAASLQDGRHTPGPKALRNHDNTSIAPVLVRARSGPSRPVPLGTDLSRAKAEARRRVADGSFYGHIAYASITARKPEDGDDRHGS
jgi:hypothetical protein